MRRKNAIINIKNNLLFFILISILNFISKKIFLVHLGSDINGINSVFGNLIGFLNIAELGITSAITFSLYKPIQQKQYEKINNILITYKYLYRFVALFIFCGTVILCFALPIFIKDSSMNMLQIKTYFLMFSIVPISSYLLSYIQIIATADQKGYIVTKVTGIVNILKIIIQIVIMLKFNSYFLWLIIEILGSIISFSVIKKIIVKKYKWINTNKNISIKHLFSENIGILTNTKNLFYHKIGTFILWQTDSLVISSFTNLINVTKYSNYMMVYNIANNLIVQFFNAITPIIGNYIAAESSNKSYDLWKKIYIIMFTVALIFCIVFYRMVNTFIELWIGEQFLLSNITVLCICINLFFGIYRHSIDCFKNSYGLFWDKYAPLVEAIMNLFISIVLVRRLGILGVVLGTNISNLFIIFFWKPFVLFKYGFKKNYIEYFIILFKVAIINCSILFLVFMIDITIFSFDLSLNWINFIILGIYYASLTTIVSILILVPFLKLSTTIFDDINIKYYVKKLKILNIIKRKV